MNFPVQYNMVASSNHPEVGYAMTRLLSSPMVRADLSDNVRWIATNSTATDPDLVLSGPNGITGFRFVQDVQVKPPAYACNLMWVLVNYWNLYRSTMDTALLPDLYAILRGSVNHQAHLAAKGADGKYHLQPMNSPEYPLGAAGGDTNYQLALFKWGLSTLFKICALLESCDADPRLALFRDMHENLAPFPSDARGLKISKDTSVATSHRHYSHLVPCWNTGMLSWDNADDRTLCIKSLDNWHAGANNGACNAGAFYDESKCNPGKDMTWEWDGFSYPGAFLFPIA